MVAVPLGREASGSLRHDDRPSIVGHKRGLVRGSALFFYRLSSFANSNTDPDRTRSFDSKAALAVFQWEDSLPVAALQLDELFAESPWALLIGFGGVISLRNFGWSQGLFQCSLKLPRGVWPGWPLVKGDTSSGVTYVRVRRLWLCVFVRVCELLFSCPFFLFYFPLLLFILWFFSFLSSFSYIFCLPEAWSFYGSFSFSLNFIFLCSFFFIITTTLREKWLLWSGASVEMLTRVQ